MFSLLDSKHSFNIVRDLIEARKLVVSLLKPALIDFFLGHLGAVKQAITQHWR